MIEEFIEFCRSRGDETYEYLSNEHCAVAQFLKATARAKEPNVAGESYTSDSGEEISLDPLMDALAVKHPRTFAGIASRYEAAA